MEINLEKEYYFPVSFNYKGVWCNELIVKLDGNILGGWIEMYNNWGEKIFSGNTKDGLIYASRLLQGEIA